MFGEKLLSKEVQKAVQSFIRAGFNVSPGVIEILSASEDPEKVAKSILEKVEQMREKPLVIIPQLFWEPITKESLAYFVPGMQIKEDWDFAHANTQKYTHGLHAYPARMIPQIAHRLIERYSEPYDLVLDPFCGSGTVLTEARLMRSHANAEPDPPRNAVGNDINPLALLLAKVKSKPIMPHKLDKHTTFLLRNVEEDIIRLRNGQITVETPTQATFPNLTHWFKDYVIEELAVIRDNINKLRDRVFRDFVRVCFSLTVRKVSNIYNPGDTFIKRLSSDKLEKYQPDVLKTFKVYVKESISLMKSFSRACYAETEINITFADARNLPFADDSIDLIVTSPPYGEERNTISYTRWSKLSSLWLGYDVSFVRRIEKASLGGKDNPSLHTASQTLNEILNETARKDVRLAKSAASFFRDYFMCLEEMHRVLKKGHYCCIVIGNRSLKRKRIPMDAVTREFGRKIGFRHEKTYYRKIPTKAIPWVCAKGETIARENVIVLKKVEA
jgi:DNA modification methylase